jgi:hypothetical protein
MILVDSDIPMYLVGAAHPHKSDVQRMLERHIAAGDSVPMLGSAPPWQFEGGRTESRLPPNDDGFPKLPKHGIGSAILRNSILITPCRYLRRALRSKRSVTGEVVLNREDSMWG